MIEKLVRMLAKMDLGADQWHIFADEMNEFVNSPSQDMDLVAQFQRVEFKLEHVIGIEDRLNDQAMKVDLKLDKIDKLSMDLKTAREDGARNLNKITQIIKDLRSDYNGLRVEYKSLKDREVTPPPTINLPPTYNPKVIRSIKIPPKPKPEPFNTFFWLY